MLYDLTMPLSSVVCHPWTKNVVMYLLNLKSQPHSLQMNENVKKEGIKVVRGKSRSLGNSII